MTTIGVDVDGPLYQWVKTAAYMLRTYRLCPIPHGVDWCTEWDSINQYTTSDDRKWLWSEGVDKGLFRYGFTSRGARRGLEQLHELGHTLVVATMRPENAREDTEAWLALFFNKIPFELVITQGHNKNSVEASILIDDNPDTVRAWAGTYRKAILFDAPWNRADVHTGLMIQRAHGWDEVVQMIGDIG